MFDVLATFFRISATPATDSFDSGIDVDPLVELYTFVDLDFAFGIFGFQLYLRYEKLVFGRFGHHTLTVDDPSLA